MPADGAVTLTLTHDEALVLHDLLQRFSASGGLTLEDQAEQRALWNLACLLERELVEPFSPDHAAALAAARQMLRDPE
ncbi:MAG: hypothetical protein IPF77_12720 [Gemmatimonadetes bacterium]|nr:hypothetical protein [Gemmatimonadota bacterium]MBK9691150.1 hypothetical protein [Gemmatimonadota bacterium]